MTLTVTEHIPGFAEGFTPRRAEVETWQQALALDWLKPEGQLVVKPYGSQFLISDHTPTGKSWVRAFVEETASEL